MSTSTEKAHKSPRLNGIYMLLLVLLGYLLLYIYAPDKTALALGKSLSILQNLLAVFLLVMLLMGLFNALIGTQKIAHLLTRGAGTRGLLIALGGGILSHGSSYVWYQMLAELRAHKVSDGLIIAFLYTRSIKLPWLPLMVSYFGLAFTSLFVFYIILAAIMQAVFVDKNV